MPEKLPNPDDKELGLLVVKRLYEQWQYSSFRRVGGGHRGRPGEGVRGLRRGRPGDLGGHPSRHPQRCCVATVHGGHAHQRS